MLKLFIERKDFYISLLLEHLTISLIAISIAIIIGALFGILISEFKSSAKPTLSVINFLYTIPSLSMLGFLIPFSGVGNTTAIIALTIYALLPMVRNTYTGINNVDATILEAAKGLGSTKLQILFFIKIPLALPVIMAGIRNMFTMTIALTSIASFIGAGGLGVAIYRGITTNNAAMTMVGSILIATLALTIDFVLGIIEKLLSKRSVKSKNRRRIVIFTSIIIFILFIINAIFPKEKKEVIRIATKPMTEQHILGEMIGMLISENTDLSVEITQGVGGGTSNIQPAMVNGEFDIYPEYTATGWNMVLKEKGVYSEDLFDYLQNEYKKRFNLQWVCMYGFNNTYGIAVRSEIAKKYNLKTYSDLRAVADKLSFGANYDFFEREDGYNALCASYGFKFNKTMDMDIGLKYQAINNNKIDVMTIFTTDGQLSVSDIVVLEDDKHFYPSYKCYNIVRTEILEKYPELYNILEMLNGKITDELMAKMNYSVEADGKNPKDVAKEFLQSIGLLK